MRSAGDTARLVSRRRVAAWARKHVLRKDRRSMDPAVASRAAHWIRLIAEDARSHARRSVSEVLQGQPNFPVERLRGWLHENFPADLRAYKSFRREVFRQIPEIRNDEAVGGFAQRVRVIAKDYFHPKVVDDFAEIFFNEMHVRKYRENGFFFLDKKEAARYLDSHPRAIDDAFISLHISRGQQDSIWGSLRGSVVVRMMEYNPLRGMLPAFITGVIKQEYLRMKRG